MEVRIISTEIIKPSSPTPHHLKTHKISITDQFVRHTYFPVILFYLEVDKRRNKISDDLKKSLSEILVPYYPFAGRVIDEYSIDCDDNGVPFIEAHVSIEMSEVLKRPEITIIEQLLPCNLNEKVNLAVQLNYFDCGGVAICVYFAHAVADATAAANFVKNWATVASTGSNDIKDVTFDWTSIFPPHDFTISLPGSLDGNHVTKFFRFDGSKVAALREKISNNGSCHLFHPTRFEAVSAVIWGASIAMARESNESDPGAVIPVNLRKRMSPPLPPHCIGNIVLLTTANVMKMDKTIDYSNLARNIHKSIKLVNEDYVRKASEDNYAFFISVIEETRNSKMFHFTGWVGLPFYETDFGWGKPTWVTTAIRYENCAILFDTSDGKGIEAWVGLSESNMAMAKFEKDPGILTYASFDPSI